MLTKLPVEIQVTLLRLCPESALKNSSSYFYLLYNDLFYDKLVRTFGDDVVHVLAKLYPWLRTYIKSLDCFRRECREIVSKRLALKDFGADYKSVPAEELVKAQYVKDSWRYVFSLFKNKRLFAEYSDYKIDEPTNYIFNHFVEINRSYLLSYSKSVWLAPGRYNLNIGLVVKHGSGLGTTKFEVRYQLRDGKEVSQTLYPPTNINEILPKKQFCFLKIGEFSIPHDESESMTTGDDKHHQLHKVIVTMEEIGLYLKSGFRIFFIDISQPSVLLNDYDLLFYTCPETDYRHYINLPLKNFYKALEHVQNDGGADACKESRYGEGDPEKIESQYDYDLSTIDETVLSSEQNLMAYAEYFFNSTSRKILYRFNTVYQRAQFINRFGDFQLDYQEHVGAVHCTYDKYGLKRRLPTIGEL